MIDLLLKATTIFTLALVALWVGSRFSASLRHRIVAVAFGASLLLPLIAALTPARVITVRGSMEPAQSAPSVIARIYSTGAAFFLLSLAAGIVRLRRLRHDASVSEIGEAIADELAEREGIRRPVDVLVSPHISVPVTFGWRRPAILLPQESCEWDGSTIRNAVRHEIEHIARLDWPTQLIARVACALYWPHPEAWILWWKWALEAERACDDAVLRSGAASELYAQQLIAHARRLSMSNRAAALAIATRSNLGRRIEAILDSTRRREKAGRWGTVAAAVVGIACLLSIAPLRLIAATADRTFDRFVGTWDCDYSFRRADGSVRHKRGELLFGRILDGRAIQDFWITYPTAGEKERKIGTSVRFFDTDLKQWRVVFISPQFNYLVTVQGGVVDDRIVLTGVDKDGSRIRWSFNDIKSDSFTWRGETSRDGGKTWMLEEEHHMTRRPSE